MRPGVIAVALGLLPGCFSRTTTELELAPRNVELMRPGQARPTSFFLTFLDRNRGNISVKASVVHYCTREIVSVTDRKEVSSREPGVSVAVMSGLLVVGGMTTFFSENAGKGPQGIAFILAGGTLFGAHQIAANKTERNLPSAERLVSQTQMPCQTLPASGVVVRARFGAMTTEAVTDESGLASLAIPLTEETLFFVQDEAAPLFAAPASPPSAPPSSAAPPASAPSPASAPPPRRGPREGELW